MSTIPVTVVGYLSVDELLCPAGLFDRVPGGAAYYCAAAAAAAGADVRLVARSAEDFPAEAFDALERLGVRLDGVERGPGLSRRSKLLDASGRDRTLAHIADATWWEATARLAPPVPAGSGIFVYTAMPVDSLRRHLEAREPRDILIVDTSPAYAGVSGPELLSLLPKMHGFAPSREETRQLLPLLDDDAAVAELARRVPLVVQKRGPDGLVLQRQGGGLLHEATAATSIVDTTGAGDSVVGALAAGIAAGSDDRTILRRCAIVAARVCAGVGIAALSRLQPCCLPSRSIRRTSVEERGS